MLPYLAVDFFLNNQPGALIIQKHSVRKLCMFRASSLPIIRGFLLYIRHWQVSCRVWWPFPNRVRMERSYLKRNLFTHLDYRKSFDCLAAWGVIFLNLIVNAGFENEQFWAFGYLRRRATIIYIHFNDPSVKRFVITSALTRRRILHV